MQTIVYSTHLCSQRNSCEKLSCKNYEAVFGNNANKKIGEHLPVDLVIEILCRLPIKSLTVFKCVSKSWNKLISDVCLPRISADICVLNLYRGKYRRLHDSYHFSEKSPELNYVGSIPKDDDDNTRYCQVDCCNGLSLYQAVSVCRYVVVSLATNQCFSIPEPLEVSGQSFAAIVFDPVKSNDYKIVLPCPRIDSPMVDIFSSEYGKWVRHKVPGNWVKHLLVPGSDNPKHRWIKWAKKAVYLNGMLYILTLKKKMCLVQFDLKSATVSAQVIKVPCSGGPSGLIGHSKGVLYYTNYDKKCRLLMWQFDHHNTTGSVWILKYCIRMNDMLGKNQATLPTMKVFDRWPDRLFEPFGIHPFLDIIFLGLQGRVYSYHLESQKCEIVWWPDRCMSWRDDVVYPFSYSYVNVKDFRKPDQLITIMDAIMANVSGDDTIDQRGND
ncbi:hypothetical protein MKW94_001110 [Papaver nudicaule]|uniref:F-box domain-containing protein n=1 Tax=Papaver nudicaule TaxID=74823 RepID=A0AA41S2Y4_PAPNU|nr:hypothetical protein [Papaver nudicaule]